MKHFKQKPNTTTCGAVCLRMIFSHRKINGSIKNIYENISDDESFGIKMCKNILILRYLIKLGFQSCIVSVKNLEKVLDICSKNKINVIFNLRPGIDSYSGHYILYIKHDNKFVYVNDPAKTKGNTKISFNTLKKCLTPIDFSPIVEKNTLVLVNTYKKKLKIIEFKCDIDSNKKIQCFECINKYVKKVICPIHDNFFRI